MINSSCQNPGQDSRCLAYLAADVKGAHLKQLRASPMENQELNSLGSGLDIVNSSTGNTALTLSPTNALTGLDAVGKSLDFPETPAFPG